MHDRHKDIITIHTQSDKRSQPDQTKKSQQNHGSTVVFIFASQEEFYTNAAHSFAALGPSHCVPGPQCSNLTV